MSEFTNVWEQLFDHLAVPESAMRLFKEHISVDLIPENEEVREVFISVMDYIDERREAPPASWISARTGFEEFNEPEWKVQDVIDFIREAHARKRVMAITKGMSRRTNEPAEALSFGTQEIARLQAETRERGKATDLSELDSIFEEMTRHDDDAPTVTYGWDPVDDELGGLRQGEIHYIAGRAGTYKSWFLLRSAVEAFKAGIPTVFFSLEMPPQECRWRMTSMLAEVCWKRLNDAVRNRQLFQLSEQEQESIRKAQQTFETWTKESGANVHILQPPMGQCTVPELWEYAREFEDVGAVYIDQYGYVEHMLPETTAHYIKHADTCRRLKRWSDEVPLYVATQFNRDGASIKEIWGAGAHIAETDAINQTADMVTVVRQTQDFKDQGIVEFGVAKGRSKEFVAWHMKVNLNYNGNIDFGNRI